MSKAFEELKREYDEWRAHVTMAMVDRQLFEAVLERCRVLEQAIIRHRQTTWGDGPVGAQADIDLYVSLQIDR